MIRKPKLASALACILTFCIVMVVVGDAVIPFGYMFVEILREPEQPQSVPILLLVPVVGLIASSFITHECTRGIVTGSCALALALVWVIGLVLFVAFPRYPTPDSFSPKIIAAVTSIPFLVAVVGTLTHSVRSVVAAYKISL